MTQYAYKITCFQFSVFQLIGELSNSIEERSNSIEERSN